MAVRVANYKGKFHTCCGTNVQLSPDRESAIIDLLGYHNFVFSSAPLFDQLFQIKYEEAGSLCPIIGVTTVSPDVYIPNDWFEVKNDKQYWYMSGNTLYHNGEKRKMKWQLFVTGDDTFGCSVKENGKFYVYKNGKELGVAWEGLPTDQPIWAFTTVNGTLRTDYIAVDGPLYTSEYKQKKVCFPSNPPEWLFCSICQALAVSPMQATCCGKLYCETCVQQWKQRSHTCPTCRSTTTSQSKFDLFVDRNAQQRINNLLVMCRNVEGGCRERMELSDLDHHLGSENGCKFQLLNCPNGCKRMIPRCSLSCHLTSHCPLREATCKFCKISSTYEGISGDHKKKCHMFPLDCPNKCGEKEIPRKDVSSHRQICPQEKVPCQYEPFGCKEKMLRKNLSQHMKDSVEQHLLLTMNRVLKLEAKVDSLMKK